MNRKLLAVAPIAAAALLVMSSSAALAAGPGPALHGHTGPIGFFPFGLVSGIAGLLFLAGFVLLIFWLIRALARPTASSQGSTASPTGPPESPLDILSRRFAAGEISADEFQKAREVLRGTPRP